MSENSDKAEELLQQSKEQKRHTTDPETDTSTGSDSPPLQEAVSESYARLEAGEMHENLTVRDADLAALMAALDETGELPAVGQRANDWLSREASAESRADVLNALLRVGLHEVASDEVEGAKEGKRQFLASQADEF